MVRHLIVFNARDGVTEAECRAMADKGRHELERIPGVLNVSFGIAVGEQLRFRYYLAIDFADRSVIDTYRNHPAHVRFAEDIFRPLAPDRVTTDYDIVF